MNSVETASDLIIFESQEYPYKCIELSTKDKSAFDFLFQSGPNPKLLIRVWIDGTDSIEDEITGLNYSELKIFRENDEVKIKQFCEELQKRFVWIESQEQWSLKIRDILTEQFQTSSIRNVRRKYGGRIRQVKPQKLQPNGMLSKYW
jgi:hypothetical protein